MIRILIFGLFILLSNTSAFCQVSVLVPKTVTAPVIDGFNEDSWDTSIDYPINNLFGGNIRNTADLSASWKALWDEQNIYFLVTVLDDSLYNLGSSASKFWIHDCVEIFFDLLNNKDQVNTDDNPEDENYQYRFIWNLDQEPVYENPPVNGIISVSHSVIIDSKTQGYNIEIKIPWNTLIGAHPFGIPVFGKKIGMEFKVADLDRTIVPSNIWAPDAELTWTNSLKKDLKICSNFGTIQLVGDALNDLNAPEMISDLTIIPTGASSANLSFISPSDTNTGNAREYFIRYSTDSITNENWSVALEIDTIIQPSEAGTLQDFQVNNLPEGTLLWFAIQSRDYFGNLSPLSHTVKVKTFDPDAINPSTVNDLKTDSTGSFVVFLSFTATGDDENIGNASFYDLRYIEGVLSETNWNNAIHVPGIQKPAEPGTIEVVRIGGLKPLKNYSFGIKVIDERPNFSDISNIVSVSTLAYVHKRPYTMDQFIGSNAFIDVPQDKMKAVGFVREYHPWSFTEEVNDQFEYNKWNGFWDFDNYYKTLKEANIDVCPALWGSPSWLKPSDLNKPVVGNESPVIPYSYREMAELMFQYAARYGSASVDNSLLLVNAGQVKKSGLGYLKFYEDWNEQDRWWEGADKRFTPQEYSAMVSANVDGHGAEMGANLGIKQADPSARFVMGGLSVLGTEFVSEMMKWFQQNRPDKKWPVDVINMHVYCENNGSIGNSPEEFGLKQKVAEVAQWRDENVPENEFWLTEFGYDMNNLSVNRVPVFAGFTQEEVQTQWLLRSFLVLSSTGLDRAAQFMLRDQEPGNSEPRFRDCGLTSSHNTGYIPKLSWYAVYTMKNILSGLYFNHVITENSDVWAYRYTHPDSMNQVVALWCPTSDGKTFSYRLSVPQGLNRAELVTIDKSIGGVRQPLEITAGKVTVNASEMPVFIEFSFSTGVTQLPLESELFIYPNPTTNNLIIRFPGEIKRPEKRIVRILDISGRTCIHNEFDSGTSEGIIYLEKLKPGTYIISVSQGENFFRQRFVKSN